MDHRGIFWETIKILRYMKGNQRFSPDRGKFNLNSDFLEND